MATFRRCDNCGTEMKDGQEGTDEVPHFIKVIPPVNSPQVSEMYIQIKTFAGKVHHPSTTDYKRDLCRKCVYKAVGSAAGIRMQD